MPRRRCDGCAAVCSMCISIRQAAGCARCEWMAAKRCARSMVPFGIAIGEACCRGLRSCASRKRQTRFAFRSRRNVRALTHAVGPGCAVEVRFDGEVFETEDQRNWTDASFKTYGTPLAQPFPVWIERGTQIEQSVSVKLISDSIARIGITQSVE